MYRALFDEQGNRITTFVEGLHSNIPAEAVEISDEDQVLYCTGQYIRDMATCMPVKRPGPTPEEAAAAAWANLRAERDRRLKDPVVMDRLDRYRNQRDAGLETTDTAEWYQAALLYLQALRDLPENTTDPANPIWPQPPE